MNSPTEPRVTYVLTLQSALPPPPKYWDYRYAPSHNVYLISWEGVLEWL